MGGLIATHLVLRDQSAWAGLILCSAAIDVEWNLVLRSSIPTCHQEDPVVCSRPHLLVAEPLDGLLGLMDTQHRRALSTCKLGPWVWGV